MDKLLLPGSYDPVTLGHLDIIRRAAALGQVTVGVFVNPEKEGLFPTRVRVALLRAATADLPGTEVIACNGYTADYAKEHGFTRLVRGYRNERDLAYERDMAAYNLARGGVETLLLPCDPALSSVSSTAAREALSRGDTEALAAVLPAPALAYLTENGYL